MSEIDMTFIFITKDRRFLFFRLEIEFFLLWRERQSRLIGLDNYFIAMLLKTRNQKQNCRVVKFWQRCEWNKKTKTCFVDLGFRIWKLICFLFLLFLLTDSRDVLCLLFVFCYRRWRIPALKLQTTNFCPPILSFF